jgi:hypothetical protein
MISRTEVAVIRAEIERLQKAHCECTDTGAQKRIDAWIEEQKQKLVAEDSSKGTASSPPRVSEFYKKGCQEKSSASTGGSRFFLEIQPTEFRYPEDVRLVVPFS